MLDLDVDAAGYLVLRIADRKVDAAQRGPLARLDRRGANLDARFLADQIDQLAVPSRLAGSEILECTSDEEIPVTVSRGEYTEDFLSA